MIKRTNLLIIITILTMGLVILSCSGTGKGTLEERAHKRTEELFKLIKNKDYALAADYIVYRGPDRNRKWQDTYNYDDPDERERVENTCIRIRDYLLIAEKWEFGEFTVETESEGSWYIQEVIFHIEKSIERRYFVYLVIDNKLALGDID